MQDEEFEEWERDQMRKGGFKQDTEPVDDRAVEYYQLYQPTGTKYRSLTLAPSVSALPRVDDILHSLVVQLDQLETGLKQDEQDLELATKSTLESESKISALHTDKETAQSKYTFYAQLREYTDHFAELMESKASCY
jgi:hypothetical protein